MSANSHEHQDPTLQSAARADELPTGHTLVMPHHTVDIVEPVSQNLFCSGRAAQCRSTPGVQAKTLLGVFPRQAFVPSREPTRIGLSDRPAPPLPTPVLSKPARDASAAASDYVMRQAHQAFSRTLDFLRELALRMPDGPKTILEKYLEDMPGPPVHLPSESAVQRFEIFAQSLGYRGPVLWYLPHNLTVEQLALGGVLDPEWWLNEPNYLKGLPTIAPYAPPEVVGLEWIETGFWALAIPGIMPGTARRTFTQQQTLLAEISRTVGLAVNHHHIDHRESMQAFVMAAPETAIFFALARFADALLTDMPFSVRTAQNLWTYQPEVDPRSSILPGEVWSSPVPSLYEKLHVCVGVSGKNRLTLHDRGDEAEMLDLGLCPFFVPFIY